MELLLDRGSPLSWAVAAVLLVSGVAATFIGVRDGLVRRRVRASSGDITGWGAIVAGLLYVATGVAGVVGAIAFALRAS